MTTAIQACCSESRRSRYGAQPRSRSLIDTSAASAVSGTVKPALRHLCVPNIRFSMDAENRRGKFATG